jgi:hypothetical protein
VLPPSPLNQPACKPGSVWREACAARVTTIPLGRRLPGASSNLPGRPDPDTGPGPPRLREEARAVPIRSCSRWGLPCRFRCRKRGALLPHRFTLTPPSPLRVSAGGLLSVALSLGPIRREPTRPRRTLSGTACPWSPDFPLGAAFRHCPKRPSGRLTGKVWGRGASASRAPREGWSTDAMHPEPTSRCGRGRSSCARCACRGCRARLDTSRACHTGCRRRAGAHR